MRKPAFTRTQRAWVYGLCLAALPLLVAYGLVDMKVAPLWAAFALALFNLTPADRED